MAKIKERKTLSEYTLPFFAGEDKIDITVRVKRARTLRMRVDKNGEVVLTLPFHLTKSDALGFIEKNRDWIIKNHSRALEEKKKAPTFRDETTVRYLGRDLMLRVFEGKKTDVCRIDDVIILTVSGADGVEKRRTAVSAFLAKQFLIYITQRVNYFAALTGLRPGKISLRKMSSRWGSCTVTTGDIRFSTELISKTPEEVDYVVLHELCHIRYHNHGPEFHAMLSRFMPSFRKIEKKMNGKAE